MLSVRDQRTCGRTTAAQQWRKGVPWTACWSSEDVPRRVMVNLPNACHGGPGWRWTRRRLGCCVGMGEEFSSGYFSSPCGRDGNLYKKVPISGLE